MAKPKKLIVAEGKYLRLVRAGNWEYAERCTVAGAVVIVAVTPGQKVLLTEQYRVPVDARVIELPAGLVGDLPEQADEEWAVAARRELLEETGYAARSMKKVAGGPISAGFGNELIEIFLATGLTKEHDGGGVDGEDIVVHEVPLATASAWLKRKARSGVLVDPKVYAGLYFTR